MNDLNLFFSLLCVHIVLKDEFRVLPINTQVAQGKTVIMQCSPPKGRPEPNVHWLHDGQKIYMDSGRFRLDGTNLVINDVMKDDQGQYQCIAKNMIGVRESPAVTLKVLGKYIAFILMNLFQLIDNVRSSFS